MITLYLDTTSNFLFSALIKDNNTIDEIKEKLDKDLSSLALHKINELLNNNGVTIDEISKIMVVNGPGSFTGIRIGLTIAKTLAWAKNIPIVPISSIEAMSQSCLDSSIRYIAPLIDARRGFVFGAIYDKTNDDWIIREQYIKFEDLENKMNELNGSKCYMTNDNIIVENDISILAYSPLFDIIVENFKDRKAVNPHSIDANYLKLTEAEEKNDH